jgi:L-cystine transport system substrate-binding protein
MRRTFLTLLAALLAAATLAGCGGGGGAGSDTLRVGTEGTYSPFSFQGPDGKLTGYDIEVVTAVAGKLGKKVEFTQTPFDSIFAGLEAKRFDIIANQVTVTDERKAKYDLSEPYTVSEGVIVTRADDTSITSLADLKGKTTAQSSTSNWAGVARDAGANVEAVEGFVQAIQLLKDRRVDATVNDTLAVGDYQRAKNDTSIKVAGKTGDTSDQAFAMLKGSGLVADVNKALDELRADGTLKTISEKYFGSDVSSAA